MLSGCNTKDESKSPWTKFKRKHQLMQGTDVPIQKHPCVCTLKMGITYNLGLHVLPYIECTNNRNREANKCL